MNTSRSFAATCTSYSKALFNTFFKRCRRDFCVVILVCFIPETIQGMMKSKTQEELAKELDDALSLLSRVTNSGERASTPQPLASAMGSQASSAISSVESSVCPTPDTQSGELKFKLDTLGFLPYDPYVRPRTPFSIERPGNQTGESRDQGDAHNLHSGRQSDYTRQIRSARTAQAAAAEQRALVLTREPGAQLSAAERVAPQSTPDRQHAAARKLSRPAALMFTQEERQKLRAAQELPETVEFREVRP